MTNPIRPDPYWLKVAEELDVGSHVKIHCECSPDRAPSLMVNNRSEGYSAWCFRCGHEGGGFVAKRLSFRERFVQLQEQKEADDKAVASTHMDGTDDVTEWADEAVQWLLKAGISMKVARRDLRITWNTKLQRLVIPVYDEDGDMVWYNARSFDPNRPKYLSPRKDKGNLVFAPTQMRASYYAVPSHALILHEDMLSAWKVASCGYKAWSILGTKLTNPVLNRILDEEPSKVITWLDPDEAGQTNARIIRQRLEVYGIKTANVVSSMDPKNHSREEINKYLKGVHNGT